MSNIIREEFIWEFARIGKTPSVFKNLQYNNLIYNNKNSLTTNRAKVINTVLFPTYLNSTLVDEDNYHLKKINHQNFSGAGVTTSQSESMESFLAENLKTQIKKNLRRTLSRLDECFNISYVYYHGSITEEKFDFLLSTLKELLKKRFDQKNLDNHFLNNWKKNIDGLFDLINQKKASFFVVYDNTKPISISLNRHFENSILFSECNGYDLDYSKFGLGHLDNYLLVKWCIENKYDFLDLGTGVVDYKKRWCDEYYDFEYLIYYKKKSILAKAIAFYEINKIKIKNLIKQYKIDVFLKQVKHKIKSTDTHNSNQANMVFDVNTIDSLNNYEKNKLEELNIYLPETKHIRQAIYDYQYLNKIHIDNIIIYEVINEQNIFLLQTPKETLKIILTNED